MDNSNRPKKPDASNLWSDTTEKTFFEKLKQSHGSYNKTKKCISKAFEIVTENDNARISEAISLVEYAIKNFQDDEAALAYAYKANAEILEFYAHRYYESFEYYEKWSDLHTNLVGHEFSRVRVLLRAHHLKAAKDVIGLYLSLKDQILELPSRSYRFWLSVLTSSMYEFDNLMPESIRLAKEALDIYYEYTPTYLQGKIKKLKSVPDGINVTKEEVAILETRVKKANN
jgi:tetratricopeptide (TPR) repeat protein